MPDLNGTAPSWLKALWRPPENPTPEVSKVALASRAALSTLEDYLKYTAANPEESAASLEAARRMGAALQDVCHAAIRTPSDVQAKCGVLREFVAQLPADDRRVQAFVIAFGLELSDVVDRQLR